MTNAIPQSEDQFPEISLEEETTNPSTKRKEEQEATLITTNSAEDDDNGVPEATRRRRAVSPEITPSGKLEENLSGDDGLPSKITSAEVNPVTSMQETLVNNPRLDPPGFLAAKSPSKNLAGTMVNNTVNPKKSPKAQELMAQQGRSLLHSGSLKRKEPDGAMNCCPLDAMAERSIPGHSGLRPMKKKQKSPQTKQPDTTYSAIRTSTTKGKYATEIACTAEQPTQKQTSSSPWWEDLWEAHFLELVAYKAQNEHANPPGTKTTNHADFKLAQWLFHQRITYRRRKLDLVKARRLCILGCDGFHNPNNLRNKPKTWETRFLELAAYKVRNGHANPPNTRGKREADKQLSFWLSNQRGAYRGGTLVLVKAERLHSLGCFGFREIQQPRATWETRFLELTTYKVRNGHANPPTTRGMSEADKKLSIWLKNQRSQHKRGALVLDKSERLHSLGCDGFHDLEGTRKQIQQPRATWETRFLELTAYKVRNGHANPPQSKNQSRADYLLSLWLYNQREAYREGELDLDKAERLRSLGCDRFHDPNNIKKLKTWETLFLELTAYKDQNGHANPRFTKGKEGEVEFKLATWLKYQQRRYRRGVLVLEKVERFRSLGCDGFYPN